MLLAGDEFGNTQKGNNNPYCQDNDISWINWNDLAKNQSLFEFVQKLIRLRQSHPALRNGTQPSRCGLPAFSKHGIRAWYLDPAPDNRTVAVLFTGVDAVQDRDDIVYIAINAHWESVTVQVPRLPGRLRWYQAVDTGLPPGEDIVEDPAQMKTIGSMLTLMPRSVVVLTGR